MLLKAVILQFEMLIIVNDYGGYEVPQSASWRTRRHSGVIQFGSKGLRIGPWVGGSDMNLSLSPKA